MLTIETLEQGVKYVKSYNVNSVRDLIEGFSFIY